MIFKESEISTFYDNCHKTVIFVGHNNSQANYLIFQERL